MSDDERDREEFGEVVIGAVMARQYEAVALRYKQAIEDSTTLPSERLEMASAWAASLTKAQAWVKKRDEAADIYIAGLARIFATEDAGT